MNEIKKAVVLCSGGFDSVVLTHYVKNELEYEHGYCLFFNYHQKSYEVEKKWAEEHCNRVGYTFIEVELPKFTWTNGGFYDEYFEDTKHQYLESRNKVFLAFATSLAEAKKCEKIFIGAIGGEGKIIMTVHLNTLIVKQKLYKKVQVFLFLFARLFAIH